MLMPLCAVILLSVRLAVIAFSSVSLSVLDHSSFSRSACFRFDERLSFCDEAGGQNERAHRKILSMRSDHRFGDMRQLHEELVLRAVFLGELRSIANNRLADGVHVRNLPFAAA